MMKMSEINQTTMPEIIKPEEKPKKIWSIREKWLLLPSLVVAILFDRLIIASVLNVSFSRQYPAAFWLSYLAIFCIFYRERIKRDKVLIYVTICSALLGAWNFMFSSFYNHEYAIISALVLPGVLMAHAQWAAGNYSLKNPAAIVLEWFAGWFIKPFSGIPAVFGSVSALLSEKNRSVAGRAVTGAALAAALLIVIVPLLMSADMVFNYYVTNMFSGWDVWRLAFHSVFVIITFMLFYSFLWNVGFGERPKTATIATKSKDIDIVISSIALGSVMFVYMLFCLVQFTYLFARAGLPYGITYAQYAREGFAQTVIVCAINLLLFGVFIWKSKNEKILKWMLGGLLALTVIMLLSGAVRLNLYIDTFGMTWLRLLSAWFITYLGMVITLCVVRIFKKELPIVGLSALLLLIWYIALGYLNPDGFIGWFNYTMLAY